MKSAVAAFAFFLGLASVAQAQESTPETEHGRFTFKQVSDGLLRLDARTGEVALCGSRGQRSIGIAGSDVGVHGDRRGKVATLFEKLRHSPVSSFGGGIGGGSARQGGVGCQYGRVGQPSLDDSGEFLR